MSHFSKHGCFVWIIRNPTDYGDQLIMTTVTVALTKRIIFKAIPKKIQNKAVPAALYEFYCYNRTTFGHRYVLLTVMLRGLVTRHLLPFSHSRKLLAVSSRLYNKVLRILANIKPSQTRSDGVENLKPLRCMSSNPNTSCN
ncbi:hypothetical protein HW555_001056 [Spodoptera exigua]|uniref:Uncharacterized protein n=1 Tax=Spodoptera exigua TaxID=7107 RepID=A0A835GR15_SPOEX|nr:hypothetical protein HW555_001056 [Spodoptera exigua]